jgi:hypothetical protein
LSQKTEHYGPASKTLQTTELNQMSYQQQIPINNPNAPPQFATSSSSISSPPTKYVKVNGITKLNPEYTQWQRQQTKPGQVPTSLANASVALPVVSNMEDYMKFNEAQVQGGGVERPLASNTDQALERLQNDASIGQKVGLSSDQVVDGLQSMLSKYEVPSLSLL